MDWFWRLHDCGNVGSSEFYVCRSFGLGYCSCQWYLWAYCACSYHLDVQPWCCPVDSKSYKIIMCLKMPMVMSCYEVISNINYLPIFHIHGSRTVFTKGSHRNPCYQKIGRTVALHRKLILESCRSRSGGKHDIPLPN